MTKDEIRRIIFESYKEIPETRVDFFIKKASENGIRLGVFILTLWEEYKRIIEFVNSYDYNGAWTESETGKKEYFKKSINLLNFPQYKLKGFIDSNNVLDISESLIQLSNYYKNLTNQTPKKRGGFQTSLRQDQIESLYHEMNGNYFDTSIENFKKMFSEDLSNFTPIKRKKKFTNTLLIYFTGCLFQKENPSDYVSTTEYCFKTSGLSQSLENYSNNSNGKPRGFQEIDTIIQSI